MAVNRVLGILMAVDLELWIPRQGLEFPVLTEGTFFGSGVLVVL